MVLSGLPTGTWTINPGNITGNTTSTTISGLTAGTYNYTVTNSDGCTSSASTDVVINASPVTPAAPIVGNVTQPTCALATGSVVLSGLPTGTWTINPGNITGNTTSTTISGLTAGTYNYTVTNSDGCTSNASTDVTINVAPVTPTAPIVGNVTQPTCAIATGSVVLSGLPTGTWNINPGNISGNTASTIISGLSAGTYNITVTNSDGCTSAPASNFSINTAPVTPTAPIIGNVTQPTCTIATGSIELIGLPNGTWNINPGNITGATNTTILTGLSTGSYSYTVTNSDGCTSVVSAIAVINIQPLIPNAPTTGGDQSKCEATPLQTLTATATVNAGETITWYDATGNVVTSPTLNSVGTVSYYAESSNGSCSSLTRTEVILTINAINLVQVAQPILAPCNNDNSPIREIDLDTLLPAGTTPGGSWSTEDTEADQGLIGNIFSPYLIPITTDDNIPYTFKYMVNCEVVEVKVNVDDDCSVLDDCDVIKIDVRNAFSPNGDEINKVFIIRNINQFDCFPTNTVEIYNRWGVLVYETKQYDNETRVFKGISEGRVTVDKGAQLPTGTYFYVLNYTTKTGVNKSVEGYLFLTQ